MREGLARYSTEAETAFALQGLGAHPILAAGRPEVVDAWIPRVASGEAVAAFALTEPEAGSDVAALGLAAEPDGDGFRLTGEKVFISNAPDADIYTVFARTTAAPAPGVSPRSPSRERARDCPGSRSRSSPTTRSAGSASTACRCQRITSSARSITDSGLRCEPSTSSVPSVGACAVGMAQAALDAAVDHAAERQAFGQPLSALQGVSHQLADVATRVQASRLLVHSAAAAHDAGITPNTEAAAMAKLFATETAMLAIDVAIQVHGARALERGHLLEHLYRDVRGTRIYEGASEVQREIIARQLFRRAGRGS